MQRCVVNIAVLSVASLVGQGTAPGVAGQCRTRNYETMAPVSQYLMEDRRAEVALARSAAPEAIARHTEVLVLGRHGFETAVSGTNGFTCIVGRGWTSAADADYWNPKVRVPMCMNAAAARTYLVRLVKVTELALAGHTLAQVNRITVDASSRRELPAMESGAMCYMMSKQGYGGDVLPHWPSHLMFFYSDVDPAAWGANLPGSPVLAVADPVEHLTQFVIAAQTWSDGTEALAATSHTHPSRKGTP